MNFLSKYRLGWWNAYFIGKLFLYWKGTIGFHPVENLIFLALLAWPMDQRRWRLLRNFLAIPLALALLYYDSWLPKISRVLSQASLLKSFDSAYLIELIGRFINIQIIAILALMLFLYWLTSRWIRIGVLVFGSIIASLFSQMYIDSVASSQASHAVAENQDAHTTTAASVNDVLGSFFSEEKHRKVAFPKASGNNPFDLIFIHICSLSWDDLAAVGLDTHPIWKKLDISLTQFNSAATYSGPAAVRLLRAPCGQEPHSDLYSPDPQGCYLLEELRVAGFTTSVALNHDGHFEEFLKLVEKQHINLPPLPLEHIAISQHAFDDSPIFDDYSVLSNWLTQRNKLSDARTALYYNTISLHDGNKLVGHPDSDNSHQTYRFRVSRLLDELDHFITDLDSTNRRAVVIIVPEHGAAYRGDKMQIAGLREIPSPAITLVPVGIKIVGARAPRLGGNVAVGETTSYLALSQIVANLIRTSPFDKPSGYRPADYVQDIPTTPFVAQQGDQSIVNYKGQYFLQQDNNGPLTLYDTRQ